MWITKEHLIPIKIEYYGKNKKLVKRMYGARIRRFSNVYAPTFIKIINVLKQRRTILSISKIITNIKFNKKIFQLSN